MSAGRIVVGVTVCFTTPFLASLAFGPHLSWNEVPLYLWSVGLAAALATVCFVSGFRSSPPQEEK